MSLTSFVAMKDVAGRLDVIAPRVALPSGIQLVAPPVTTNYPIVGTAFDYLLRFEIQRRMPHAEHRQWEANGAHMLIFGCAGLRGDPIALMDEMEAALNKAKRDHKSYVRGQNPGAAQRSRIATHAIRLAQMDQVNRGLRLEPYLAGVDQGDVRDLLNLLGVVPPALLAPAKRIILNPLFGASSALVGGADGDLVLDDALIDIKVTKSSASQKLWIRQLVGYFILARHARAADSTFPEINRIGIYFARHGHLWLVNADELQRHPLFSEIEQWFIARARKVFADPREQAAPMSKRRATTIKRTPRRAVRSKPSGKRRTVRKKAKRL